MNFKSALKTLKSVETEAERGEAGIEEIESLEDITFVLSLSEEMIREEVDREALRKTRLSVETSI